MLPLEEGPSLNAYTNGQMYYQVDRTQAETTPWAGAPSSSPVVSTWVYCGMLVLADGSCFVGVPSQLDVFQPYYPFSNPLDEPAELGLRFASRDDAFSSMFNFTRFVESLQSMLPPGA